MSNIICVIGPESSATRFTSTAIAQHPDIYYEDVSNIKHTDPLDNIWNIIEETNQPQTFTVDHDWVLTRRSVPHGYNGQSAKYMHMMDLNTFAVSCKQSGHNLFFLVTSRSPYPNLVSWAQKRASAEKSFGKAKTQYQESFRHIFKCLIDNPWIEYYIVSMEALVTDGDEYIKSLYHLLGIRTVATTSKYKNSNSTYYRGIR